MHAIVFLAPLCQADTSVGTMQPACSSIVSINDYTNRCASWAPRRIVCSGWMLKCPGSGEASSPFLLVDWT